MSKIIIIFNFSIKSLTNLYIYLNKYIVILSDFTNFSGEHRPGLVSRETKRRYNKEALNEQVHENEIFYFYTYYIAIDMYIYICSVLFGLAIP